MTRPASVASALSTVGAVLCREMAETVTARVEAPQLSARTSQISQLIESRAVESMPLGTDGPLGMSFVY